MAAETTFDAEPLVHTTLGYQFHAALTVIEYDPTRSPADLLDCLGLLDPLKAERSRVLALRTHEEGLARSAVLAHIPSPRDPEVRTITEMRAPSGREMARQEAAGTHTVSHKRSTGPQRSQRSI